jgi:hypothetical protein
MAALSRPAVWRALDVLAWSWLARRRASPVVEVDAEGDVVACGVDAHEVGECVDREHSASAFDEQAEVPDEPGGPVADPAQLTGPLRGVMSSAIPAPVRRQLRVPATAVSSSCW